jgi:hypothetical protein
LWIDRRKGWNGVVIMYSQWAIWVWTTLVTIVAAKCPVAPITDCDDLCNPALQSARIQLVRFDGRVASFGCVTTRATWVCSMFCIS